MYYYYAYRQKSLRRNEILTWIYHLIQGFKMTSKLNFQILTPPRIYFFSFCRDIQFQSFDYFSAFSYKIKFVKFYIGSEKTCIEYIYM